MLISPFAVLSCFVAFLIFQIISSWVLLFLVRSSVKEQRQLAKEIFGLYRRIEVLTADDREKLVIYLNRVIDDLAESIPELVSNKASRAIFETESQILKRLTEIEPLINDQQTKDKLHQLISSMEQLEGEVVAVTTKAVREAMTKTREELFETGNYTN